MKLTFELEHNHTEMLFEALKISKEQFDRVWDKNRSKLKGEDELAYRILQARLALDLSNSTHECCHDFVMPESLEAKP